MAPRAVQRNGATTTAEQAFIDSPEGQTLASQYMHRFALQSEIGAVTGLGTEHATAPLTVTGDGVNEVWHVVKAE